MRVYASNDAVTVDSTPSLIPEDGVETFRLTFADFGLPYGQILPKDTNIQISATGGTLGGVTDYTVPNSIGSANPTAYNGQHIDFSILNTNSTLVAGEAPVDGELRITATTPSGRVTTLIFNYTLAGI
jgi:hypothetical protein